MINLFEKESNSLMWRNAKQSTCCRSMRTDFKSPSSSQRPGMVTHTVHDYTTAQYGGGGAGDEVEQEGTGAGT